MSLECGVKTMVENISQSRGEKGQDKNRPGKPAESDVAQGTISKSKK